MKNATIQKYKKICGAFASGLFAVPGALAFAATSIAPVLLQPTAFPGVTNTSNLGCFLGQVFNFGIALAVVLALIMIIIGGIEYMTTDSWEKKDSGKERIINALWGLGLALISWLLLYTINPNLVTFSGNLLIGTAKCS